MQLEVVTHVDEDGEKAITDATSEANDVLQNYAPVDVIAITAQQTAILAADGIVYTRYTILIQVNP